MLAWKRSPTWFFEESTPSIMRTNSRVPAGTVTFPPVAVALSADRASVEATPLGAPEAAGDAPEAEDLPVKVRATTSLTRNTSTFPFISKRTCAAVPRRYLSLLLCPVLSKGKPRAAPGNNRALLYNRCSQTNCGLFTLVPEEGVEPTRPCGHRILSPARLPVPPLRRILVQHNIAWPWPQPACQPLLARIRCDEYTPGRYGGESCFLFRPCHYRNCGPAGREAARSVRLLVPDCNAVSGRL